MMYCLQSFAIGEWWKNFGYVIKFRSALDMQRYLEYDCGIPTRIVSVGADFSILPRLKVTKADRKL